MSETQKFAELDKLVGGLKQVTGLPEKERNKTPKHKKWRAAVDALPKEEKKEYIQLQKYLNALNQDCGILINFPFPGEDEPEVII